MIAEVAAALASVLPAPAASQAAVADMEPLLSRAMAAYKAKDCKTVLSLLSTKLDKLDATTGQRSLGYNLVVTCSLSSGDPERALAVARLATQGSGASAYVWRVRFTLEVALNQNEAAIKTLETMAQTDGSALDTVPLLSLNNFAQRLDNAHADDLLLRLFKVGTAPSYHPDNPFVPADVLRFHYVELLVKKGDTIGAANVTKQIEDPGSRVRLALEFQGKEQADNVPARQLAEARVARYQALAQQHPELLKGSYYVARRLRQLGQPADAQKVLMAARPDVDDPAHFTDRDEWLSAWWNEVARVDLALGDLNSAFEALKTAAELPEDGHPNVSEAINFMLAESQFGRPADALARTDQFIRSGVKLSSYGDLQLHVARACAAAKLGDKALELREFNIVNGMSPDIESMGEVLVCRGDLDAVAQDFIRRLSDPKSRLDPLMLLAEYDATPRGTVDDPLYAALPQIRRRPDVMAAVAKAGGAPVIHYVFTE